MIRLFGHLFAPDDRGPSLVTIEGGRIESIEPISASASVTTDERLRGAIGGPDSLVVPGLLDIQLNGAFGTDFEDPAADMATICRDLTRFGLTGFVPTLITSAPDAYGPALENLHRRSVPGSASILGVHVEGPFLSPNYHGTHNPAWLRDPDPAMALGWLDAGDVAYITLAPERPGALALIETMVRRGVRVSIGHTDANWDQAAAAASAGATMATHLFNAMRPLRHRDPGVIGYALASNLRTGFIADGVHLAFETIRMIGRLKFPDQAYLVTDALSGIGMPPGRYTLADVEYISDGVSCRLPDGTLSGSLLPINRALRNLVERVGVAPATAVELATLSPARALGLDGSIGRIESGRAGDVTVLGPDWEVTATIAGGQVAYLARGAAGGVQVGTR